MLPVGILTLVLMYSEDEKPVEYVGGVDDLKLIEERTEFPENALSPIEVR